jgi:MFS family permease
MSRPSLWRHPDFVRLWAGQTVSVFGSMLTRIALPLTALLSLGSGPIQLGLLRAAEAGPMLVAGLFAGVLVDRLRRRRIMMAADLARAAILASIPLAAAAGRLTMAHLYLVAASAAFCTTFFDAAYPAYLPTLAGRDRLVEGNATLTGSAAVAEMGGFASAGVLVQAVGGPMTVLVDAWTFVVSALSLAWIRTPEPRAPDAQARRHAVAEAVDGLRVLWETPGLRALVACSTTMSLAGGVFGALYMLFAVRDLGLSPSAAGIIAGCGGVGSLAGAALAGPTLRRVGPKATLVLGFGLGGACQLLVPLAHGAAWSAGLYLVTAQVLGDGLMTIALVNDVSLRQSLVDDRLLGRVSATANLLGVAAMPLGALAGGVVGQVAGPRVALAGAALGFAAAALWIVPAPLVARTGRGASTA